VSFGALLFFLVQFGYGALAATRAATHLWEPQRVGLGVMGICFATAAVLFITAVAKGLRDGTAVQTSRLFFPASALMLIGAVSMVVGLLID